MMIDPALIRVTTTLPFADQHATGQPIPVGLIGAKIVAFGGAGFDAEVEGGLVIDYIPEGSSTVKRVVLGFNDLGMWIEGECQIQNGERP